MRKPSIKTTSAIVPMIYAYTTPQIAAHDGWTKIGYTERQKVENRIRQQTKTSDVEWELAWKKTAIYDDGSGDSFTDHDFHSYLQECLVERKKGTEWFHIDKDRSQALLIDFKANRGRHSSKETTQYYTLRDEQEQAVQQTFDYFASAWRGEFLWNAKPRFGKTLAAYDLCKRLKANNEGKPFKALVVTNRPAIANSWYEDYVKFVGTDSEFLFVSETDSLKGQNFVVTFKQAETATTPSGSTPSQIVFVSLQDLKGSIHFGGAYRKLEQVKTTDWDLLIVDEAHEGVDTDKTDVAFNQITRKYTLHLSGTPFKALANEKFKKEAIYNWTYADEQRAKRDWEDERGYNPYETLPRLNLFTYQMSEIIADEIRQGVELDGNVEEYAFDLDEFFAATDKKFTHEESVDKFLDALTKLEKYPFSTPELRDELKHTLWMLNRVDSAKALAQKLMAHPVFKDYEIVLAAGDGKLSDEEETKKSYDKVKEAIAKHDKTITISVGQLTTGVTIPEWSGVLMLSTMKSPALYMQTAFRAQNPWKYQKGVQYYSKENAYVFDFDPARTLVIFEEFANDLMSELSGGKGSADQRKQNVRELLNFFPVIGEDENGEMIELDAEKVLSIPRKIRSVEVVRRGFMSNFLFQNIHNIFGAPQEVVDIISKVTPVSVGELVKVSEEERQSVIVDEEGNATPPEDVIIGQTNDLFGEKIYETISEVVEEKAQEVVEENKDCSQNKMVDALQKFADEQVVDQIVETTANKYDNLKVKDKKEIKRKLKQKTDQIIKKEVSDFEITKKEAEAKRQDALDNMQELGKTEEEINQEYDLIIDTITETFQERLPEALQEALPDLAKEAVRTVETQKMEKKKDDIENGIRNHLRGFTRTIPSFLMAYGDENTTLANFDTIVPDEVFLEVTSLTLDEFRFLRDGGPYFDKETQEEKNYPGKLFDPVVFDDSVVEFLSLKKRLANYFDESQTEDIFDYIPPQKTNQIFTPKKVVKQMVDMLEAENPGCFEEADKTFADLYMKSGLYIAEIVKRLYKSKSLKKMFPDEKERLAHIFEKQVYGLAPTEIIYRIAVNYILGFSEAGDTIRHNFKLCDSLVYAQAGNLEEKLEELYGK